MTTAGRDGVATPRAMTSFARLRQETVVIKRPPPDTAAAASETACRVKLEVSLEQARRRAQEEQARREAAEARAAAEELEAEVRREAEAAAAAARAARREAEEEARREAAAAAARRAAAGVTARRGAAGATAMRRAAADGRAGLLLAGLARRRARVALRRRLARGHGRAHHGRVTVLCLLGKSMLCISHQRDKIDKLHLQKTVAEAARVRRRWPPGTDTHTGTCNTTRWRALCAARQDNRELGIAQLRGHARW